MNEINYTYEITAVNEEARCMEIIYSSEGRETMHVGARLPFDGEQLEDIVRMYAPIQYWIEKELPVATPAVGASGALTAQVGTGGGQAANEITVPIDVVVGA